MALRLYPNDRISNYSYHHTSEKLYCSVAYLIYNNLGWNFGFHFIDKTQAIALQLAACCISLHA